MREDGFYWCRIDDDCDWQVCQFIKLENKWLFIGFDLDDSEKDSFFAEIDENQLTHS